MDPRPSEHTRSEDLRRRDSCSSGEDVSPRRDVSVTRAAEGCSGQDHA